MTPEMARSKDSRTPLPSCRKSGRRLPPTSLAAAAAVAMFEDAPLGMSNLDVSFSPVLSSVDALASLAYDPNAGLFLAFQCGEGAPEAASDEE